MLTRLVVDLSIRMLLSVSTIARSCQEQSTSTTRKHFCDLHLQLFTHVPRHNPTWNESKFLLVNSLTDNLVLTVMDNNELLKDTEIGSSVFELAKLKEDATQEDLSLPILKDGKQRGELRFDVFYFPVLKPRANESGVEELPESSEFCLRPIFGPIQNYACRCWHRAIHGPPGQRPRQFRSAWRRPERLRQGVPWQFHHPNSHLFSG